MTPELRKLSDAELFDWLRLSRTENVGPRTFHALVERYGSARAALKALPTLGGGRFAALAAPADIDAELEAAQADRIRFIAVCDPAYPPSLRTIAAAPPLLAVRGSLEILQRSMVAIVGSRNASANGLVFTDRLARGIGAAGHVVVSGLARGIDAKAHGASLESGTIAVLAGGHRRIYPGEHRDLAARIVETGAVVSEMPIAWEPRGRDFPRRNRIVSGLSLGVVVVEAARRSGSLITARFGNEQGREVFAVPGSPFDLRAEGTNDLLRAGASFCTCVEDVTSVLEPMVDRRWDLGLREMIGPGASQALYWDEVDLGENAATSGLGKVSSTDDPSPSEFPEQARSSRQRLIELIGPAAVSIDDLVRTSALPVPVVHALIVELELEGLVRRQGGGGVARSM